MKLDDKYKLNLQFLLKMAKAILEKIMMIKCQNDDDNPNKESKFTQSEVDSQISKAVETALSKRERKHQQELEKAKEEAKRG